MIPALLTKWYCTTGIVLGRMLQVGLLWILLVPPAMAVVNHTPEPENDLTARLIERIHNSGHLDISTSLDDLVASINDAATEENIERLHDLADAYYYLDKNQELEEVASRLEYIALSVSDTSHAGVALAYRTYARGSQGDYMNTTSELEAQIASARIAADDMVIVVATNLWATLIPFIGEPNIALARTIDAGELIDRTTEQDRLRLHLNFSLGYVYTELFDSDKLAEYYLKSLDAAEAGGLKTDLGTMLYNAAYTLGFNNDHQMSIRFYEELAEWYKKVDQEENLFYPHFGLARNYLQMRDYEDAWRYIERAFAGRTDSEFFEISLFQMGAEVAARLGRIDDARRYQDAAESYFVKHPELVGSTWELANKYIEAEIALAEGKYLWAYQGLYDFHTAMLERTKSEIRSDNTKLRQRLDELAGLELAQQQLAIHNKELKLRIFQILVTTVAILLGLVVYGFLAQRKSAAALLKSKREAEKANLSKTEFLANMSHELRTPLNAIMGFSEIMKLQSIEELGLEKCTDYVDIINSSGGHLLNLINEILDISKVEAGKMELIESRCEIEATIQSAVRMIEPMAMKRNIDVRHQIPAGFPDLYADQRLINQVLYNALSNAVKFNRAEGSIKVEATLLEDGNVICLNVSDQGAGMTEEELRHAMEPFNQVQGSMTRDAEGTGLGLPLMAALMELHGGELKIHSTKGAGTCVSLIFGRDRSITRSSSLPIADTA